MATVTITIEDRADGPEVAVEFDPPINRNEPDQFTDSQILGLKTIALITEFLDAETDSALIDITDFDPRMLN